MKMTPAVAVKTYLEKDSVRGKIELSEFAKFWKELSIQERVEFGAQAAKELGAELTSAL